jgi:hypothetical protein
MSAYVGIRKRIRQPAYVSIRQHRWGADLPRAAGAHLAGVARWNLGVRSRRTLLQHCLASVFVLLYQQLRQYLYLVLANPAWREPQGLEASRPQAPSVCGLKALLS